MSKKINASQINKVKEHLDIIHTLLDDIDLSSSDNNDKMNMPGFPGFVMTLLKSEANFDILNISDSFETYFDPSLAGSFGFFETYFDDKDYMILLKNLEKSFSKNINLRGDFRLSTEKRDKILWFEILFYPDKKNKKMTLIFVENTDRKKSEEQERILLELDKSSSLKSLVSCIAHEVNNPNHNIMQNVSLLENGWPDILKIMDLYYEEHGDFNIKNVQYSTVRDYLSTLMEKVLNSSRQIKSIIDDLRNFSQKSQNMHSDQIHLNYLVQKTVELLRQQINNATINFKEMYSSEMAPILGNYNQIQQVIINLLHNSFDAIENSTQEIKIFTFYNSVENVVGVGVSDKGHGMDSENVKNVFNHFHSIKSGRNGGGLGLPISKEIIDMHKGNITIDSKPGNGTTVIFKLPVIVGRK